jgi:hypothetical protein
VEISKLVTERLWPRSESCLLVYEAPQCLVKGVKGNNVEIHFLKMFISLANTYDGIEAQNVASTGIKYFFVRSDESRNWILCCK